ncbi:MAG: DUF128 domain-containing protein [Spirochaetales bacterium]|nr:DUF128 domain-containing protein [Spirochaetales bacterium]
MKIINDYFVKIKWRDAGRCEADNTNAHNRHMSKSGFQGGNGKVNSGIEKKRLSILKILKDSPEPLSSAVITEELNRMGSSISERTVRFHLLDMDRSGLTERAGKLGRLITPLGSDELSIARIHEKVGFLTARIDEMTWRMDYNIWNGTGRIVINVTLVKNSDLPTAVPLLAKSFESGFTMGELVTVIRPGETAGTVKIPWDCTGIGTVSSINVNAVLLKNSIPAVSLFGGILEISEMKPQRFLEVIKYDGTTIDPLEIFIKGKMTDIRGITETGNGRAGASFIEMPGVSRKEFIDINNAVRSAGLGGALAAGWPGKELLGIPVNEGRAGGIVPGGLNAVAFLEENGIEVKSQALSCLMDIGNMFSYRELKNRLK